MALNPNAGISQPGRLMRLQDSNSLREFIHVADGASNLKRDGSSVQGPRSKGQTLPRGVRNIFGEKREFINDVENSKGSYFQSRPKTFIQPRSVEYDVIFRSALNM